MGSTTAFAFEKVYLELGGRAILQDISFAVRRGEFVNYLVIRPGR